MHFFPPVSNPSQNKSLSSFFARIKLRNNDVFFWNVTNGLQFFQTSLRGSLLLRLESISQFCLSKIGMKSQNKIDIFLLNSYTDIQKRLLELGIFDSNVRQLFHTSVTFKFQLKFCHHLYFLFQDKNAVSDDRGRKKSFHEAI